jgi:hypothetical protein
MVEQRRWQFIVLFFDTVVSMTRRTKQNRERKKEKQMATTNIKDEE